MIESYRFTFLFFILFFIDNHFNKVQKHNGKLDNIFITQNGQVFSC